MAVLLQNIVECVKVFVELGTVVLALMFLVLLGAWGTAFVCRRLKVLARTGICVVVLAIAAVVLSDKTNGTNRAGARMGIRRIAIPTADSVTVGVTDADVTNGWCEVSRSTNAAEWKMESGQWRMVCHG